MIFFSLIIGTFISYAVFILEELNFLIYGFLYAAQATLILNFYIHLFFENLHFYHIILIFMSFFSLMSIMAFAKILMASIIGSASLGSLVATLNLSVLMLEMPPFEISHLEINIKTQISQILLIFVFLIFSGILC